MTNKLFVYGTLRMHERNHHLLNGSRCLAKQSWTFGKLYDTGYGFPAIVQDPNECVYGELYEVSDDVMGHIDVLEGYRGENQNNHYDRIQHTVYTDQSQHQAYVYVYSSQQTNSFREISLGDWKIYQLMNQGSPIRYFAYGSCMDVQRIQRDRMLDHFQAYSKRGVVSNYKLAFTRRSVDGGRADIVESSGHKVEGIVYKIDDEALDYLYKREGVNLKIYRPTVIDVEMNGKLCKDVLTFVVIDKETEVAPPAWYLKEIIRGGTGTLSEQYLSEIKNLLKLQY